MPLIFFIEVIMVLKISPSAFPMTFTVPKSCPSKESVLISIFPPYKAATDTSIDCVPLEKSTL